MNFTSITRTAMLFLVFFLGSPYGNAVSPDGIVPDLRKSVIRMLRNPDIDKNINERVRISFFVTAGKQVVVLKTDARTIELDKFIKDRMNYNTIKVDHSETNRIYHLKVNFKLNEIQVWPG